MNELIETERAYVEELLCVLEVKIKFHSDWSESISVPFGRCSYAFLISVMLILFLPHLFALVFSHIDFNACFPKNTHLGVYIIK